MKSIAIREDNIWVVAMKRQVSYQHTYLSWRVGENFTKNVTTRFFLFCFFWTFSIFSFFLREKNPTSTKNQKNCVAFAYPRTFFAWHAWEGTHAGSILRMFHHRKKVYKKHFYLSLK